MGNQYNNTAKVVKIIDTFKFVINRGSNDGVNFGENYLIFVLGEKIFDPDTGEELGLLEIVRGRARVVHVQEMISTLESADEETIPGKMRRIKRERYEGWLSFAGGPREEEIEEGAYTMKKNIAVELGDMARPV